MYLWWKTLIVFEEIKKCFAIYFIIHWLNQNVSTLSWIGCESKHDLQKKPLGKPGFFTWAFPWMWSRIKQNKLETLVYLLNWRFSSFSAIWVFRTKYCHIHSLLAAVQLLDEATCSYNLRNYADWRGCYGYSVYMTPSKICTILQIIWKTTFQTFQRILLATYI